MTVERRPLLAFGPAEVVARPTQPRVIFHVCQGRALGDKVNA